MRTGVVVLVAVDPPDELAATSSALMGMMKAAAGGPLEFDCETASGKVRMRPFYRVRNETYSTYFRRS